jgi:hypothetical protein
MSRPLSEIAREIRAHWKRPHFTADHYLRALSHLTTVSDYYGVDSGYSLVGYFLLQARTWRGPVARTLKAELRALIEEEKRSQK